MNKRSTVLVVLQIACAVCALGAEIVQLLAVLLQYDEAANYFQMGATLPTVTVILALLGVALGVASAILTEKGTLTASVFAPKNRFNPASVGFLVATVCMIAGLSAGSVTSSVWTTLFILFGLTAAFYALAVDLPALRRHTTAVTFAGFFAVLACMMLNAYYYFDFSIEMNAPLKTATQLGLLASMIYFVAELRYLLGTEMPRMFFGISLALVSVGALSSLAVPIAFFTGKLDRIDYLAGAILTLTVMLTAEIRIYRLLKVEGKGTT